MALRDRQRQQLRQLKFEPLEHRNLMAFLVLDVPGIDGGAVNAGATATDTSIETFNWGLSRSSPTEVPVIRNLSIEKRVDSATPAFVKEALIGPVHNSNPTVLRVISDQEPNIGKDLLKLALTNTRLVQFGASDALAEIADLSFTKIDVAETIETDPLTGLILPGVRLASFNLLNGATTSSSIGGTKATITDQTVLEIGTQKLLIDGFDWSAKATPDVLSDGGEFLVSRVVDSATAGLLGSAAAGTLFPTVKLTDRRIFNGTAKVYMTWTLSNVFVSSFDIRGTTEGRPTNQIGFTYSSIQLDYAQPESNFNPSLSVNWSESTGKVSYSKDFRSVNSPPEPANGFVTFDDTLKGQIAFEKIAWDTSNKVDANGVMVNVNGSFGSMKIDAPVGAFAPTIIGLLADAGTKQSIVKINAPPAETNANGVDFWTLENVTVSDFEISGFEGGEPTVSFALAFSKVTNEFAKPQSTTSKVNFDQSAQSSTSTLNFGGNTIANTDERFTLEVESNGQKSEIPINAASFGNLPNTLGFSRSSLSIDVDAVRDLHSLGLLLGSLKGTLLTSMSLVRYAKFPGSTTPDTSVETYRWTFDKVRLTKFQTEIPKSLAPGNNVTESFSFALAPTTIIEFKKNDLDANGVSTKLRTIVAEFNKSPVVTEPDPFGNYAGEKAPFPNWNSADRAFGLDEFGWGAKLPVAPTNKLGNRIAGKPSARSFEYGLQGIPNLTILKNWTTPSSSTGLKLISIVTKSRSEQFADRAFEDSKWELADLFSRISQYLYSDSIDQSGPTNQLQLQPHSGTAISFKRTPTKQGVVESQVDWTPPDATHFGTTNLIGGFGSNIFKRGSEPEITLDISDPLGSGQLAVDNYTWVTNNPVNQLVGTSASPATLAPRTTAKQQDFDLTTSLDNATPGFIAALAMGVKLRTLTITQRANIFINGAFEYLPFREWTLSDVFVTEVTNGFTSDKQSGEVHLHLNAAKVASKFTGYFTSKGRPGNLLPGRSAPPPATTISSSIDYVSPPVALGIGNLRGASQDIKIIPLPSFFTDEQEDSATLRYSVTVDNPDLFDSITINEANELVLDYKNGQSGFANVSVDATDAFDLVGTDTFQIALDQNGISDAPSGADKVVTTDESKPYVFSVADFGFSDTNDTPANNFLAVKIASLPSAGTLKMDGVPVTLNQFVAVSDVGAGKLIFTPTGTTSGTPYALFTFQVQDDGSTLNSGVTIDPTANTLTINVNPLPQIVGNVTLGSGSAARSVVRSLTVDFDTLVSIGAGAFTLDRSVFGGALAFAAPTPSQLTVNVNASTFNNGTQTRATLTFTGSLVVGGSLPDGNYRLTMVSDLITATVGSLKLDGNKDGTGGDNFVLGSLLADNFFRYFGDNDGNGAVNNSDFIQFRRTLGLASGAAQFNTNFDFDQNGAVNNSDFIQFRNRLGRARTF